MKKQSEKRMKRKKKSERKRGRNGGRRDGESRFFIQYVKRLISWASPKF